MLIEDRDSGRRFFIEVWRKHQNSAILEPLEDMVLGVILEHPEYHEILGDEERAFTLEFTPESGTVNPFLHMGMHISIKEQVQADRPAGIKALYHSLLGPSHSTIHDLEHRMMECLGEVLWVAQRDNIPPDETAYLECVRRLS